MAAAAGLAGAGYYFLAGTPTAKKAEAKVKEVSSAAADKVPGLAMKKALTGGDQGFISLKLAEVETVNHNTKRFRFAFPEEDMVSGLEVASAILTKFKPAESEKPVLRPYTPVSDEGRPSQPLTNAERPCKLTSRDSAQTPRATWTSWLRSTPTAP